MSKLSELVAVRVMGWELVTEFPRMSRIDGRTLFFEGCEYKVEDDEGQVSRWFRPDTSIADAWRVVHECKDYQPEISTYLPQGHMCIMWRDDGTPVSATEETPELAIVICALRAKGVPEREIDEARKQ